MSSIYFVYYLLNILVTLPVSIRDFKYSAVLPSFVQKHNFIASPYDLTERSQVLQSFDDADSLSLGFNSQILMVCLFWSQKIGAWSELFQKVRSVYSYFLIILFHIKVVDNVSLKIQLMDRVVVCSEHNGRAIPDIIEFFSFKALESIDIAFKKRCLNTMWWFCYLSFGVKFNFEKEESSLVHDDKLIRLLWV